MDDKCGCQVVTVAGFAEMPRAEIDYCPMHASAPEMAERVAELEGQLVSEAILRKDDSVWAGYAKRIAELEQEVRDWKLIHETTRLGLLGRNTRIEELETVLRPFAEVGTIIAKTATGAFDIPICDYSGKKIWTSDCEYARQALAGAEGET